MHTLETTRQAPARRSWRRAAARWIVTFVGFPAGGFTAMLLVGHVDTVITALAGGLITGTILGAVQAWGLGRSGPGAIRWIAATAIGLTIGLGIGATAVDFRTSLAALVVQGERYAGWRSARPRRSRCAAASAGSRSPGPRPWPLSGPSAGPSPTPRASPSTTSSPSSAAAERWSSPP
jgi:hypothetical protein